VNVNAVYMNGEMTEADDGSAAMYAGLAVAVVIFIIVIIFIICLLRRRLPHSIGQLLTYLLYWAILAVLVNLVTAAVIGNEQFFYRAKLLC